MTDRTLFNDNCDIYSYNLSKLNKYGFNLIKLQDKDVQNLDDVFPKLLLKYGIQPY